MEKFMKSQKEKRNKAASEHSRAEEKYSAILDTKTDLRMQLMNKERELEEKKEDKFQMKTTLDIKEM